MQKWNNYLFDCFENCYFLFRKFSTVDVNGEMPSNSEEAAVLWINKCCKTLEKEIRSECNPEEVSELQNLLMPEFTDLKILDKTFKIKMLSV